MVVVPILKYSYTIYKRTQRSMNADKQELDVQSRLQDKSSLPVPKLMYMDNIQLSSWKKGLTLPENVSFCMDTEI